MTRLGQGLSSGNATNAMWASAATAYGAYCSELQNTGWNNYAWSLVQGPSSSFLDYTVSTATAAAISNIAAGWSCNLTPVEVEFYANQPIASRQYAYSTFAADGLLAVEQGIESSTEVNAGFNAPQCKYDCKLMGSLAIVGALTGNEIAAEICGLWCVWNC